MKKLNNLLTPLGAINIAIDGESIPYEYIKLGQIKGRKFPLLGRYQISIDFKPDGREHDISCTINNRRLGIGQIETGERLTTINFYSEDRIKLTVGIVAESGYIYGIRYSEFDYDEFCLKNGIAYKVLSETQTSKYIFMIAWIDDVGENDLIDVGQDRDIETWFGVDPDYS